MKTLASIWAREPAVLTGAVASILAVAIVFGVHVTDAQTHAVLAAIVGVSPLIAMFVVRSQVIPSSGATGALPAPPSAQPASVAAPKVPPLVLLALAAVLLTGCAGLTPRDAAVDWINGSSTLASQVEPVLAKLYQGEQDDCLALKAPASPKACVESVRARYAKAWTAYGDFLAARLAAIALINTYDAVQGVGAQPSAAAIAKVVGDLAAAEAAFSSAAATVKGSSL